MPRILLEPTELRNVGDAAMMEVAVARLRAIWPQAGLGYFGEPGERLRRDMGVEPVAVEGRHLWFDEPFLDLGPLFHLRGGAARIRTDLEAFVRPRWPALVHRLLAFRLHHRERTADGRAVEAFFETVRGADVVFACGMGGITDAFPYSASQLLGMMELAKAQGARTVLVGQGIGPLETPELRAQATRVLRKVDFIALREARVGRDLLLSMGVRPEKILVTGDEAIELAFERRPEALGRGVGVNLRIASYSRLDGSVLERVRSVLHGFLHTTGAIPVPAPISHAPGDDDAGTIRRLLSEALPGSDGGRDLTHPAAVIDHVASCRVVLTGSYHAAVFALSMGIPAVALAGSRYYDDKFRGLRDQFGGGCDVIPLDTGDWPDRLAEALSTAWDAAPERRSGLLEAAARQIEMGREAYRRIGRMVEPRTRALEVERNAATRCP